MSLACKLKFTVNVCSALIACKVKFPVARIFKIAVAVVSRGGISDGRMIDDFGSEIKIYFPVVSQKTFIINRNEHEFISSDLFIAGHIPFNGI